MSIGNYDRTWAEVNLDCVIHNFQEFVRIKARQKTRVLAVVKANAYGHGAIAVSRELEAQNVDYLGVATLDEAIELRNAGILAPILVFYPGFPNSNGDAMRHGITQTVFNLNHAEVLSAEAVKNGVKAKVHVKVDTGMTRSGVCWENAAKTILGIAALPGLEVEGMFSHFACADEPQKSYTQMQIERFSDAIRELERNGLEIPLKHICNSAGAVLHPEAHFDMLRPGISLYGYYPSPETNIGQIELKPAMSLKTRISRIIEVERDVSVSYGGLFVTNRKTRLATLPVGYADGFSRMLTGKANVCVNGNIVPVTGRICMDMCMCDVTDVPAEIGDEVTLYGGDGEAITADNVAQAMGTISYEVLCMVARRVPRVYLRGGNVAGDARYL